MPLMIGAVRYANSETILLMDRSVFETPVWMHLPHYRVGAVLVIEYDVIEGRNVLTAVPQVRE